MTLWRDSMPKGMLLKSDGFATNLTAPGEGFPLERFYRDTGRADYSHTGLRIPVETLVEYGLEFQRRCVGSVDEAKVVRVSRVSEGFDIGLDTGFMASASSCSAVGSPPWNRRLCFRSRAQASRSWHASQSDGPTPRTRTRPNATRPGATGPPCSVSAGPILGLDPAGAHGSGPRRPPRSTACRLGCGRPRPTRPPAPLDRVG